MSLLIYKALCSIQAVSLITSATMMIFWPFLFADHVLLDASLATPAYIEAGKVSGILLLVLGFYAFAATHYHSKKAIVYCRINVLYSVVTGIFYGWLHSNSSVFRWEFAVTSAVAAALFGVAFLYMALTLPRTKLVSKTTKKR